MRLAELNTKTSHRKCNCLPSCTTLQYECNDRKVSYIAKPSLKSTSPDENITDVPPDLDSDNSLNGSRSKFDCIFTVYYRDRDTLGIVRVGLLTFSDFLGKLSKLKISKFDQNPVSKSWTQTIWIQNKIFRVPGRIRNHIFQKSFFEVKRMI